VLATNGSTALILPAVGLWREPEPLRVVLGALGILLFSAAQGAVLHALVTPWLSAAARRRATMAFAAAAAASVPLVGPMGGTWPSWSWLAACIVGVLPVVTGRRAAAVASVAVVATALLLDRDALPDAAVISAGVGAGIAAINGLQVWFWDLLVQAEQGRTAQARLAATEERLRFARDVHDLLGHHLSVIALKAELAERLVTVDAERARDQAAEVRRLAASALADLREVVHGYRRVDLREHLTAIEQVLRSSGVRCTVTLPAGDLPADVATPLAAVLREATTNVLRHSAATWCTIGIDRAGGQTRMTVVNDGAGAGRGDEHSYGLRGLAERLAESGGTLRTRAEAGRFTLEAAVPSRP
jgi:two-component system, NarL family, sensor histidine kinase DesK